MSPLVFLGIAMGLSLAGVLVLWLRNRQPQSVDAHIRAFSRELEALAPDPAVYPQARSEASGGQPTSGQPRTGQPRTGQSQIGPPRTGQSGIGQARTGQSGIGQPRMGQTRPGLPGRQHPKRGRRSG